MRNRRMRNFLLNPPPSAKWTEQHKQMQPPHFQFPCLLQLTSKSKVRQSPKPSAERKMLFLTTILFARAKLSRGCKIVSVTSMLISRASVPSRASIGISCQAWSQDRLRPSAAKDADTITEFSCKRRLPDSTRL